ncbi:uncharacterized protein conserved in bacteria [Hahella chejuensis KCTC 2396]|uniref:Uncharacterized protein conserved in bacteria n=1 Tax=Hahella chejuensis (strain KCTC 2396) TaxID=349521 RepID=Q2SF14_HAHCH|nr:L,D-transpeptidase family protein [Hahella chejuensis]ABC30760.1 uncharacterized protein conserved in bacteria [Hahella chejuensis KCTC 2396]
MSKKFKFVMVGVSLAATLALTCFYKFGRSVWVPLYLDLKGRRTVDDVMRNIGPVVEPGLQDAFARAGVTYPPQRITLLAFKEEKRLELWAEQDGVQVLVSAYPIQAASGVAGPKLREGDRQVPEGFYRIEGFNPNSSFHLSMKLNYPSPFDLKHAQAEGRTSPGGDIFIHGKASSVGCLAMGDPAVEDLFILANRVGVTNIDVIIAPHDFRMRAPEATPQSAPAWLPELYQDIEQSLRPFAVSDVKSS